MKRTGLCTWRHLTEGGSVRWLKYSFGPGTASTLAIRLEDDTWLVVSPPIDAPDAVFDELARDGTVSAMLAPNAYHHRGQEAWRRRFPEATSYAAEGARTRLRKQSPGVPYQPLDELLRRLPQSIQIVEPAGQKTPDLLLRVSTGAETVWWLGDLFSNSTTDDQIWPLRMLGRLAGSGLGYRRNSKPGVVYVREPGAWLRSVRTAIEAHPPTIVLPAHGDPVVDDTARRTRELLSESTTATADNSSH